MARAPSLLLPLAAALLLAIAASGPALACTTILAGKKATSDGSMYLARTVDYIAPAVTNNLVHHPARDGPARFASNWNSFAIELPGPGLSYLAAPSTLTQSLGGQGLSLEEIGVNSAGVVVSATETITASAAALAADPLNKDAGINEDAIASVLLPHPRATSARATVQVACGGGPAGSSCGHDSSAAARCRSVCIVPALQTPTGLLNTRTHSLNAMQLLGELIARHGSSEGFGVLVADASESWYLENAAGHHWLAQRLPDGSFFASANQHRFQEVDLKAANTDGSAVLASEGLQEFAVAAGLWAGDADATFNFFKAFASDTPVDASANCE